MKVIDFNNVKKICSQLNSNNYLEWIEYALRHKNDFVMPPKTRISQEMVIIMLLCHVCMKKKILR